MLRNQLPNGIHDEFGLGAQVKETVTNEIQQYFARRGFTKITTPVVEYQDVFAAYDVGQTKLYKFLAANGEPVVLRPDLTLPVARVISSTNFNLPVKFYYAGDIFRINRELSGSQDETTQAGVELIGFKSVKAEQECLVMMLQLAQQFELTNVQIELGIARFARQILNLLVADHKQVKQIESALFQKQIAQYNRLIAAFKNNEIYPFLKDWPRLFGCAQSILSQLSNYTLPPLVIEKLQELSRTVTWLQSTFPTQSIQIDLSAKAPQDYYTGLTFQVYSDQSDSYLFSGGRYDHLLAHFQAENISAVGFGIDINRLAAIKQATVQRPTKTFLFFDDQHWQTAEQKLLEIPNSVLCLVDDRATAQKIATQNNGELLDLTMEVPK